MVQTRAMNRASNELLRIRLNEDRTEPDVFAQRNVATAPIFDDYKFFLFH